MNDDTTFRPNVKLIIAKRFVMEAKANIYAAFLRDHGINCFISNTNAGTLIPFVDGGFGFLLHIAETDKEEALLLLQQLDEQSETRVDEDFRDADFSDIEYEKSISEYEDRVKRGSGKFLVWLFIILALILAAIFTILSRDKPTSGTYGDVRQTAPQGWYGVRTATIG